MISPALVSRSQFSACFCARSRRGLSLVELMAATVISLIVMGATVQLFGTVGNQISNGRSNIELGDRIRTAVERLRKDLRGHTADTLAWNRAEDASGYFEIVKGPLSTWDMKSSPTTASTTPGGTLTGYAPNVVSLSNPPKLVQGDMLFFTTRSRDQPFVGRLQTSSVESQVAEVAWYLYPTLLGTSPNQTQTIPPTYTLCRRQLLVLPGLKASVVSGTPPAIVASSYYDTAALSGQVPLCDISAHPDGGSTPYPGNNMILNSLADLSYRENRFGHFFAPAGASGAVFPFLPSANTQVFTPFPNTPSTDPNLRFGEDVVLSNVLSFDIKVWDPWAQVLQDSNKPPNALVPSDPGYSSGTTIGQNGVFGAYVDLNWGSGVTTPKPNPQGVPAPYFVNGSYGAGNKTTQTALVGTATNPATYDTWSAGYESWAPSPLPQPTSGYNESSNGFDDLGANGVDNPNERITCPPYPVPLRGIQIKIRTYEFTSKQVREVTLQESFVPD